MKQENSGGKPPKFSFDQVYVDLKNPSLIKKVEALQKLMTHLIDLETDQI